MAPMGWVADCLLLGSGTRKADFKVPTHFDCSVPHSGHCTWCARICLSSISEASKMRKCPRSATKRRLMA